VERLRKIPFWFHLSAGCVAGLVILIMSVTGVLLAFQKQITAYAERNQRFVAVPPAASRLSPEALLAALNSRRAPTNITWSSHPGAAVEVSFGRDQTLFVNPYTGAALGEGSAALRAFFHRVEDWHRWLGVSSGVREIGRGTTGACNFAFLLMICSGFYLWLPRRWPWRSARAIFFFRGGLSGKARDFNWHNVIGLWCCVPLFLIIACSVVMSYPWANSLVYRISGSEPPKQLAPPQAQQAGTSDSSFIDTSNLSRLCALAESKVPGWRTISLRLPRASDPSAVFVIDSGNGGLPQNRAQLALNRKTLAESRWETFDTYNRGRRWRFWIRFTHTGEAFGFVGQFVASVAALGGVFLVYTGLSLAIRRFLAWRARPSQTSALRPEWSEPDPAIRET